MDFSATQGMIAAMIALAGGAAYWGIVQGQYEAIHTQWARSGRCRNCGYSMHLLPSWRCPECGHEDVDAWRAAQF